LRAASLSAGTSRSTTSFHFALGLVVFVSGQGLALTFAPGVAEPKREFEILAVLAGFVTAGRAGHITVTGAHAPD
jgi:hypothetical protein